MLADDARAASGAAAFASPGSDASERRLAELLAAICVDELKALGACFVKDTYIHTHVRAHARSLGTTSAGFAWHSLHGCARFLLVTRLHTALQDSAKAQNACRSNARKE